LPIFFIVTEPQRKHDIKAVVDHIVAETYKGLDVSERAAAAS
jgi:hypothetical protein